jgi:hypothetical protein
MLTINGDPVQFREELAKEGPERKKLKNLHC